VAVDAFLRLRDELASAQGVQGSPPPSSASPSRPKVLFAIDDYNALYGRTGYGRSDDDDEGEGRRRRVPLKVDDLTLVRNPLTPHLADILAHVLISTYIIS